MVGVESIVYRRSHYIVNDFGILQIAEPLLSGPLLSGPLLSGPLLHGERLHLAADRFAECYGTTSEIDAHRSWCAIEL